MDSQNSSARETLQALLVRMNKHILGQPKICQRLLLALLSDGHILIEGYPGLAKTRAMNLLAQHLKATSRRIQFTPDLEPSEVVGSELFHFQGESEIYTFRPGPIFENLVMLDEINRAPTQVQAITLEAMEERQVTKSGDTYKLPHLFMVVATQNPIEQAGTFPLPEASKDRFLMNIMIDYPTEAVERQVLRLVREEQRTDAHDHVELVHESVIHEARAQVQDVRVPDEIETLIVHLAHISRNSILFDSDLAKHIKLGVSPRGSIALDRCARAYAWLEGRDEVTRDDIKELLYDCFRHRLLLTEQAMTENVKPEEVVDMIAKCADS